MVLVKYLHSSVELCTK